MRRFFLVLLMIMSMMSLVAQIDQGRLDWIENNCKREIQLYGYFQFPFQFFDFSERHLNIDFVRKDVICISNIAYRNSGPCAELSFSDLYAVHFENNHIIIVDSLLSTNRKEYQSSKLVMPFDYSDTIACCNSIFPILLCGDRFLIQKQFQKIWINSFTFDIRTITDDEAREFDIWFWRQATGKCDD